MLHGESANARGERAAAGLKRAANAPTSDSVSLVLSEDAPNLAVRSLRAFAHRGAAVLKRTRMKRHCTTVFASGSRLSRIDTFDTKRAGNRTSPLRL